MDGSSARGEKDRRERGREGGREGGKEREGGNEEEDIPWQALDCIGPEVTRSMGDSHLPVLSGDICR